MIKTFVVIFILSSLIQETFCKGEDCFAIQNCSSCDSKDKSIWAGCDPGYTLKTDSNTCAETCLDITNCSSCTSNKAKCASCVD